MADSHFAEQLFKQNKIKGVRAHFYFIFDDALNSSLYGCKIIMVTDEACY